MAPLFRRPVATGLLGTAARTAVVAGTAQAVGGRVAARQRARAEAEAAQQAAAAQQAVAAQLPVAGEPVDPMIAKLQQLGDLHAQGVLSDEEFAAAKARILGL